MERINARRRAKQQMAARKTQPQARTLSLSNPRELVIGKGYTPRVLDTATK